MEEEAEKLKEMQKQVEETIMSPPASQPACKMKRYFLYRNLNLVQPVLANPFMHFTDSRSGWI